MKKIIQPLLVFTISIIITALSNTLNAQAPLKAMEPVLLTSCGQSPGPIRMKVFLKAINHTSEPLATAKMLADAKKNGKPYKTLIIVTGASLKGMGAAGTSIDDELARMKTLIAEAKKQGIKVIGSHIEGMDRRSQGASAGDTSDEQSIDAVCPLSDLLLIKKDGNSDGRFTVISKNKKIPMIEFEKNSDLNKSLNDIFSKK